MGWSRAPAPPGQLPPRLPAQSFFMAPLLFSSSCFMPLPLFVLLHPCSSLSFLALTTASLLAGFRPSGSCGGHPQMLGRAGQTQVVVFPGILCPVLPGKGQLAGQVGGGALLGCPRSSLWPLQAGEYKGKGVRPWLSHLSTPWEGRQGLGRERSPKWPRLSAEAGPLASSIGPLCDLHQALCLLCPHFSFVQCR